MKNSLRTITNLLVTLTVTLLFISCGKDTLTPTTDMDDLKTLQRSEADCVNMDLHVYLEGAYNASTQKMNANLHTRGLLPGQTLNGIGTPTPSGHPYSATPWNHNKTEGGNWTNADYKGIETDWVLVSFRTGETKNTEIAAAAALLNQDGSITFTDNCVLSTDMASKVYVVIEHRNHMGIMSSKLLDISGGKLTYDFRMKDSYTDDLAGVGQKEIASGVWAMYAGDTDQTDNFSYDINGRDNNWNQFNGMFNAYLSADLNLDGDVNGKDKHIWSSNNGVSSRVPK